MINFSAQGRCVAICYYVQHISRMKSLSYSKYIPTDGDVFVNRDLSFFDFDLIPDFLIRYVNVSHSYLF